MITFLSFFNIQVASVLMFSINYIGSFQMNCFPYSIKTQCLFINQTWGLWVKILILNSKLSIDFYFRCFWLKKCCIVSRSTKVQNSIFRLFQSIFEILVTFRLGLDQWTIFLKFELYYFWLLSNFVNTLNGINKTIFSNCI